MVQYRLVVKASIIVPAFNEVESIPLWLSELVPVAEELGAEVVVVDDGSTDGTAEEAEKHPGIRCVRIAHSGKTAALRAGVEAAAANTVVTIDADLQEFPAQISQLLGALTAETDLVTGYRVQRADGRWRKRIPSRIYRGVIGLLFGARFRDINCGFRVGRKSALLRALPFEGAHRLIPLLVQRAGGRVAEVPVQHRVRRAGTAKFDSPMRFLEGLRDLFRVRFGPADGERAQSTRGSAARP